MSPDYNHMHNGGCSSTFGSSHDCGYGSKKQNWFGNYFMGEANPYGFVSSMPYGYGSGAVPFYGNPAFGGLPGTSYAPGGYIASALPLARPNRRFLFQ